MWSLAESFFKTFDKMIMVAKNIQVQVSVDKSDSQKEVDLKVVDLVKKIERNMILQTLN